MSDTKRRRDPEKTRQKIDEAALELFAEQGFAGTATSEIARRAGVAEGTIFRHYPNKKAVLIGVMAPVIQRVMAPLATRKIKRILGEQHADVEALLGELLRERIDFMQHAPRFLRVVMQEASLHPDVRDLVADVFLAQVRPVFGEQLDDLKARGLVDASLNNDSVMRMIISVVAGYVLLAHMLYTDHSFDDAQEIDQMVRVLARGLAPAARNDPPRKEEPR